MWLGLGVHFIFIYLFIFVFFNHNGLQPQLEPTTAGLRAVKPGRKFFF
jgi:hypothetical protein